MKSFLYSVLGAVVGIAIIEFMYRFVHIPIIPCIAVYATTYLASFGALEHPIPATVSVGAVALYGILSWGVLIYDSIAFYPAYKNVLGIIFDIATAFAFLTAAVLFIPVIFTESRRLREQQKGTEYLRRKRLPPEWRFTLVVMAMVCLYIYLLTYPIKADVGLLILIYLWGATIVFAYIFLPIAFARHHLKKGGKSAIITALSVIGISFFFHMVLLILGGNTITIDVVWPTAILAAIAIWGAYSAQKEYSAFVAAQNDAPPPDSPAPDGMPTTTFSSPPKGPLYTLRALCCILLAIGIAFGVVGWEYYNKAAALSAQNAKLEEEVFDLTSKNTELQDLASALKNRLRVVQEEADKRQAELYDLRFGAQ